MCISADVGKPLGGLVHQQGGTDCDHHCEVVYALHLRVILARISSFRRIKL